MDLYKIVGPNGECLNGGDGDWSLPVGDAPGDWRTVEGPLEACRNGLHVATAEQVPTWLNPERGVVYRVEVRADPDRPELPYLIDAGSKWVARSVRLLPRSKPAPDIAALQRKRDRAMARARKALDVAVPERWRAYLTAVGFTKLPAAHPAAQYQNASVAAHAAWSRAHRKAQADYDAAVMRGAMPD